MTTRTITFDDEQWQVVPKRPTEDMLLRGYDTLMVWDARTGADIGMRDMFLAMLAVAPEPPAQEPPADCQSAFEAWFGFSVGPDMDLQTYVAWQHWQVAWNAAQPPAQQPMSRDREVWRAAITLANNICVQESDRYNGDDATQEALATGYCAQRIRDWIAPTDEQFAELLDEAGIGKGESNEG